MRYLKLSLFCLVALLFTACGNNNTYFLMTDDARGLEAGDPVYRQGIMVGEVEDVRFEGNQVKIEIDIKEPLYEDQHFNIRNNAEGHQLSLARPGRDANALADGAVVKDYLGGDFLEGLENLGQGLDGLGEALGNSLENAFGREGEKLERSLDELANRLERSGEGLGEAISNWAEEQEEDLGKLERDLEKWAEENEGDFKAWGEEMDAWGEEFEGDIEDLVEGMNSASEKHEVGSKAWKREVKRLIKKR